MAYQGRSGPYPSFRGELRGRYALYAILPFVATLLGVAFALPSPHSDYVMHETRAAEPIYWAKTGRLDFNRVLPMRFGLVQHNFHRLEEMLMSVSHPEPPKYAQPFTPMEVVDTFAPSEETISAINNWLVNSGFSRDHLRLSRATRAGFTLML